MKSFASLNAETAQYVLSRRQYEVTNHHRQSCTLTIKQLEDHLLLKYATPLTASRVALHRSSKKYKIRGIDVRFRLMFRSALTNRKAFILILRVTVLN